MLTSDDAYKASVRALHISMLRKGYPSGDMQTYRFYALALRSGRLDRDPEMRDAVVTWLDIADDVARRQSCRTR